jgi:hypothetical protein
MRGLPSLDPSFNLKPLMMTGWASPPYLFPGGPAPMWAFLLVNENTLSTASGLLKVGMLEQSYSIRGKGRKATGDLLWDRGSATLSNKEQYYNGEDRLDMHCRNVMYV